MLSVIQFIFCVYAFIYLRQMAKQNQPAQAQNSVYGFNVSGIIGF